MSQRPSSEPARGGAWWFAGPLAGLLSGLPVSLWLFGFTVDDALIPMRMAAQIAAGNGYRFNAHGPIVDASTPLGLPYVWLPFVRADLWQSLEGVRWFGLLLGWASLAVAGAAIGRLGVRWQRWLVLAVLCVCAPIAAWSSAGLETPIVTLLVTLGTCSRGRLGLLPVGLAAAMRPELLAWALVMGLGRGWPGGAERRVSHLLVALALSVGPFLAVALLRALLFGQPAPLSALAKPGTLAQGSFYVLHALLWTGPFWLLVSRQLLRVPKREGIVALAALAHALAVLLAGGDWMTLHRLFVPILPSLLVVGAAVQERSRPWAALVRTGVGFVAAALLLSDLGPAARRIVEQRRALTSRAEAVLAKSQVVGTLDVGWVGAATKAEVFDFAGVTDPRVAILCCGHHAKRIPRDLLSRSGVDALVLLLAPGESLEEPWWESRFARTSENLLAEQLAESGFEPVLELQLLYTPQRYVILKRDAYLATLSKLSNAGPLSPQSLP